MSAVATLQGHLSDLRKGGVPFFVGGLLSRLRRTKVIGVSVPIPLSGSARVFVRPRQTDFSVLRQIFRDKEYSLPDAAADRVDREYARILANRRTPVIIDAGANIGAASIWLKKRFPDAAIVAIEPDPENAALARHNVAEMTNVTVLEAAVGGEPGFAAVQPAEQAWAVKTERADDGCPIVTIGQALATVPDGQLLLVKVDIEGFEYDLFRGDLDWLDQVTGVFIEPHDWMLPGKGTSRSFQYAFGVRDFEMFVRGENLIYLRRDSTD